MIQGLQVNSEQAEWHADLKADQIQARNASAQWAYTIGITGILLLIDN